MPTKFSYKPLSQQYVVCVGILGLFFWGGGGWGGRGLDGNSCDLYLKTQVDIYKPNANGGLG